MGMLSLHLRRLRGMLAAAVLPLLAAAPAAAHPHVWIVFESTVLVEKGTFVGVQHKWTFDEFYTAMAIEGLDKNKDGRYDREELAELAKVNMDGLKDFSFFTFPTLQGQALKVGEPSQYWLEHTDGVLSLHFTLPLAQPVLVEAEGFAFAVRDPAYFIAFAPAKDNPVKFSLGAPKACKAAFGEPPGEQGQASGLAESFAAIGGATVGNEAVMIDCTGRMPVAKAAPGLKPGPKVATAPPDAGLAPVPTPSPRARPAAAPQAQPLSSASAFARAGNWLIEKQAQVHQSLRNAVGNVKTANPFMAALFLAAVSFAYGVLHAAGPGHGKAVISSYVLADGQTVRRGVALAFLAALIQALSALVLVGVLMLVLNATDLHRRAIEAWLETASWGLVAAIGGWLLYYQYRTLRNGHAHAHGHAHHGQHGHHHHAHAHDHAHPQHGHHHGHAHGHAHHDHAHDAACETCAHLPSAAELKGDWSWRRALALAFAVGIRPCTGAILVLVFAIGQGLMWAGIFSTFAMALGTAITVSVLAAGAVGFRELAKRLAGGGASKWADRIQLAAGFGGAGLVLVLGLAFFLASLGSAKPF
jgi:ABC-type nickel/cobalt efflux system permease component RcnA/ABC-type uncharacterized transport system substrate-binding protein